MSSLVWPLIILMVLVGHFGMMLAGYNRINGFGFPRRVIKTIVKVMFAFTILLPGMVLWFYFDQVMNLWQTESLSGGNTLRAWPQPISQLPFWLLGYSSLCLLSWLVLGIPWLIYRPILGLEWVDAPRQTEVVDVRFVAKHPLPLSLKCKLESRLPMNQLFELAIDQIELPVAKLPTSLDGYRIAHLSDIHLTGDVHPDYSSYVVARASRWQPDLMAVSGDIIDKRCCIDWLGDIFGQAAAPDGCYYVLGNHDTRIAESWQTRDAMDRAGWTDLGSRSIEINLWGVPSLVIGNEHPWYRRPELNVDDQHPFRLLVSHSPDQFRWARRHHVTLMLAGHTHGGQGRLPLAGPLLSPSFHGSRYASGDFFKPPTTMHVTRGLGGTHLVRFRCRPQLSLLTLRAV